MLEKFAEYFSEDAKSGPTKQKANRLQHSLEGACTWRFLFEENLFYAPDLYHQFMITIGFEILNALMQLVI
jgi:hypothetical protein